jgi:pimeloyl-ACP methyl ester carboxylesterase
LRSRFAFVATFAASLMASGCESVIQAQAALDHPVRGKLVEVEKKRTGVRNIQIDCRGEGGPTVVFQSGGDLLGSLAWSPVHDKVASTTRACAYSRAGLMWSDPVSGPFTPEEVARDLHAALDVEGERGPYVLVAHSRGGLYNLIFAGLYPDDVAGFVFADSSHPDQEQRYTAAGIQRVPYVSAGEEAAIALSWTGLMRLQPYPTDPAIASEVQAFQPKSAAANAREARERNATMAAASKYRDLRNWPLIVLARELPEQTAARAEADSRDQYLLADDGTNAPLVNAPKAEEVWRDLQKDIATWSSRGRLVIVPNSNHAFFFTRPDVVVEAVREVVQASRAKVRQPQYPGLKTPAQRFRPPYPDWQSP